MECHEAGDFESNTSNINDIKAIEMKIQELESSLFELQKLLVEEKEQLKQERVETEELAQKHGIALPPSKGHLPLCPLSRCFTLASVPKPLKCKVHPNLSHSEVERIDVYPTTAEPNYDSICVSSATKLPPQDLIDKLKEVDSMCKREMARVNLTAKRLAPLNQIASDWKIQEEGIALNFQPKINEIKTLVPCEAKNIEEEGMLEDEYVRDSGTLLPYRSPIQRITDDSRDLRENQRITMDKVELQLMELKRFANSALYDSGLLQNT